MKIKDCQDEYCSVFKYNVTDSTFWIKCLAYISKIKIKLRRNEDKTWPNVKLINKHN